ncbi:LamG domain-containing protein [Lentzea sp.]|uniref:LamG domain-containing protein n=1 Tax=Lentzea sp. TaxID=56099 RepID=UPI002ED4CB10
MTVAAGVPVRWAPESGGPRSLFVEAVDAQGVRTRSKFDFHVASPAPAVGYWLAGDDPAFDGTGNGHDLLMTGLDTARAGRTVAGQHAVGFDGVVSSGATTAQVLDTGRAFSVSSWVQLTDDTVDRTAVSQQGSAESAFRLGFDAATHRWEFALAESDAVGAVQEVAQSDTPAAVGVWTHLTGVYDGREVRLYVDGVLQSATASVDGGFDAGGELWIGKALRGSASAEPWHGALVEMNAWNRAITPQEVRGMVDPGTVSEVGQWMFNEGLGRIALDSSPYGRDLRVDLTGGGARWAGSPLGGHSLEFNGTNGVALTGEPVLYTDQSFTVDVWAEVGAVGVPGAVVGQRGAAGVDPFTLRYDGVRWSAEMPDAAVSPATVWQAKADAVAGQWTHLVATYNASARTLTLTVGYQDSPDVVTSVVSSVVGWNSDGVLSVGRSFHGGVDELKVLQTAMAF